MRGALCGPWRPGDPCAATRPLCGSAPWPAGAPQPERGQRPASVGLVVRAAPWAWACVVSRVPRSGGSRAWPVSAVTVVNFFIILIKAPCGVFYTQPRRRCPRCWPAMSHREHGGRRGTRSRGVWQAPRSPQTEEEQRPDRKEAEGGGACQQASVRNKRRTGSGWRPK